MKYKVIEIENKVKVVRIEDKSIIISDEQSAIDMFMKLAIIGDFSNYDNKALKDFIYECNSGNDVFFIENEAKALSLLSKK